MVTVIAMEIVIAIVTAMIIMEKMEIVIVVLVVMKRII